MLDLYSHILQRFDLDSARGKPISIPVSTAEMPHAMKQIISKIFVRNEFLIPALIFTLGVVSALLLSFEFKRNVEHGALLQFERNASDTQHVIEARLAAYTDVIRGLRALFETQDAVSRVQFHDYVASLDLKRRNPGFILLNYAVYVNEIDKERFEESVRRGTSLNPSGYPGFAIKPPGNRPEYHVLAYLEPMVDVSLGRDILLTSPAQGAVEPDQSERR